MLLLGITAGLLKSLENARFDSKGPDGAYDFAVLFHPVALDDACLGSHDRGELAKENVAQGLGRSGRPRCIAHGREVVWL